MPDDNKKPFAFKITEPRDGVARTYANVSHLVWSGMDLTTHLYQLVQPNRDIPADADAPNELLHTASVTFTWPAAKTFHSLLGEVLERYEKVHGPIKTDFKAI
jgi:hypothetical protein